MSSLKKTELCVRTQSKFACNHQPVDKTTGKIDKDCFLQSCTSGPQEFGGRSEWRFLVWCPMEQCNSGLPISTRVVIRSSHMPLSECFLSQSYTGSVFRHCWNSQTQSRFACKHLVCVSSRDDGCDVVIRSSQNSP